jgi:hypothetical protein
MESEEKTNYVEINYSQLFECLLRKESFKKMQEQELELFRRLCKIMDELKPTFDFLEELECMAEIEKDEDLRGVLNAQIQETKIYLAPYEKELSEINNKLDALK